MVDQVRVKGESGVVFTMDLPLHWAIEDRLRKGYLTIVNDNGARAVIPQKPAVNEPKREWVGWAVAQSEGTENPLSADDAEGMTKQDLIERFG